MDFEESEVRRIIHDLNDMSATVLGSAELILTDADDGSQIPGDANNIRAAALRGRDLMETLRGNLNLR